MTVVSFSMAYRSFRGGSGRLHTRLDTPPLINRRHPDSCLARRTARRGNRDRGPDPREVFSGRHLFTTPNGEMAFLDAAGTCLIPVQHDPPINPMLDDQTTMGKCIVLRCRA